MQNKTKRPLIISGPSGTGKEEIIKVLMSTIYPFQRTVSVTTRGKRVGEVHGKHYTFTDVADFAGRRERSEFLESVQVHNSDWYGTPVSEVERLRLNGVIPIIEVDVNGALRLSEILSEAAFVFVSPPSLEELSQRLHKRATDSHKSIEIRLMAAAEEMKVATMPPFQTVINGDNIFRTVSDIFDIWRAD